MDFFGIGNLTLEGKILFYFGIFCIGWFIPDFMVIIYNIVKRTSK